MTKFCAVCLTLIVSTCLAGIVIETSKSHKSADLVEAAVKVLTSCYRNRIQAVSFAGNTPGTLLRVLWAQESLPVTLIDNASRHVANSPVRRESRYKLQLFIVTTSSATQLKQVLKQVKDSPWWNHMASFFIVDWSTDSKHGCSNVSEFLWTTWEMNLLNAKFMCIHRTRGILIYSYNPYTSQAPPSWRVENILKGKNDHPWTLIVREYRKGDKICEDLDFEKTTDLNGYEIRATVKDVPHHWHTDINKTGIDSFSEWNGVLAQYIFRALNATPNLKAYKVTDGPGYSNGNVTDIVTDLIDGTSEIMLTHRVPVFHENTTFTYPCSYIAYVIATQNRGHASQLSKILSVIDGYSRFCLLLVALVTLIFFKCFLRQTIMSAVMNLLRIVCNSCLLRLPANLPAQIYLASLFFLYVTILAIYQGKLASVLTMQESVRNVDTMQDLADLGYTLYIFHSLFNLFCDSKFQGRCIKIYHFDCLEYALRDSTAACMWIREDLMEKNKGLNANVKLHRSKNLAATIKLAYLIREDWPLEQRLNKIIMALIEANIIWKESTKNNGALLESEKFYDKIANTNSFKIITLDQLIFAFVILGFGLGCASVCFIVEVAIERTRTTISCFLGLFCVLLLSRNVASTSVIDKTRENENDMNGVDTEKELSRRCEVTFSRLELEITRQPTSLGYGFDEHETPEDAIREQQRTLLVKKSLPQVSTFDPLSKGPCEVLGGQSNIILDIEESRGKAFDEVTVPEELPVTGNLNETTLEFVFPGKPPLFTLQGKKLKLLSPLDRDSENLSHVVFQLICTVKSTKKKRSIPVIVRVSDINDNAPKFINTPYETTVPELTPVGSTIFQNVVAVDADAGVNGLVEYSIALGDGMRNGNNDGIGRNRITTADGYGFFSINLPHQGQVTVNRTLDFEKTQRYLVTILASDRARNVSERFTSTTTLTVNIRDDDDQDPSFIYQGCMLLNAACINPEYSTSISSGVLSGILNISPEKIQAIDMDSINAPIQYSFLSGSPANYRDFFEINPTTGAVKQIKAVDTTVTKQFDIIIKAVEVSEAQRSATAKLTITVKPVDSNPPVITASSIEGFVDENAPVGTKVIDKNGKPIVLTVSDADLGSEDPKPTYTFEITTSFFSIDQSGSLIVHEENLDRDPPSPGRFRFQVVAREKTGAAASSPLSFVVTLNDVNDNAPQLPMTAPITVQAGETRQEVIKVEATDNDEGENAEITYSIYHISNNGLQKFKIDPKSGVIESVRKLNAGEQYSITVRATDNGGKYSQTIVEVNVIPGPNTRSPVFQQPVYEVQVSEGASINSTVATITALDPENDPVSYSIVSGNDLRQFSIGDKSGVITVIRKLDREDLTRYQLLIKAEDEGGLSSTATVNIKVTDINDKNPEFEGLPYEFSVKEGEARKLIGRVYAKDADEGINAEVTYFAPDDIPFTVDPETGDVLTKIALDYEQNHEYKFVVTARDGAPDHRLATATVTVKVLDMEDEVPVFHQSSYEARVKENVPDYMVIQVIADDPDTKKQITYVIKQGDTELFNIDSKTGVIKTIRGLDYERDAQHILIIGTLENTSELPGSTTRVVINVQDVNDIPPVFTSVPRPTTLDDDVPIGTTVINLLAQDSDGTAPGNQVRYEIIGRGIANKYFVIDPDTGIMTVRDDLRKETDSEYQVDVRVYDLGEPQLSSVTTVPIFVRHVATVAPEIGLGFAEDSYNVDVPEDARDNALIKIITIINSHTHDSTPLKCEIYSGNENGLFEANVTEERNCALRLKKGVLDYETTESYQIKIKLESLSGLLNADRNTTMVKIQVIDVNDNKPEFIFPEDSQGLRKGRYFAAIPRTAQFSSTVMQVKAQDKDNGKYGKLEYKMLEGRGTEYLAMDSSSGIIKTIGTFDNVEPEELPFKFRVQVRDNPNSTTNYNKAEASVIVNLIDANNLLVLVIQNAAAETLQKEASKIIGVIEEKSGLLIGIDRIAVRKTLTKNGTVETHPQDSDVWFYAVDSESGRILDRNNTLLQRSILEKPAMSSIIYDVSTIVRANAVDIHEPVTVLEQPIRTQTAIAFSGEYYPYALIVIACVILAFGIAGIIYICVSWSRYKAYKERMQRMYVVPRYDPVFVETDLKEYETQVLRMSVPNDDNDSYNDLQLDFSHKNHAFSLDNVSYITKDHGGSTGQQSPVSSEAATTARASSIAGNHQDANVHSIRRSTLGRKNNATPSNTNTINNHDTTPVLNPLYNHAGDLLSPSPSNDNVTFRERKDYSHLGFTYLGEQSPVETTTEL